MFAGDRLTAGVGCVVAEEGHQMKVVNLTIQRIQPSKALRRRSRNQRYPQSEQRHNKMKRIDISLPDTQREKLTHLQRTFCCGCNQQKKSKRRGKLKAMEFCAGIAMNFLKSRAEPSCSFFCRVRPRLWLAVVGVSLQASNLVIM